MVMNEKDCYNYRKGNRTDEEFKENIIKKIEEEEYYVKMYIGAYHDRRRHKEISYKPLGNKEFNNQVIKNLDDLSKVIKPDYLINRKYDGSDKIRKQYPLEVQTCSSLKPEICYVRKHKILHFLNYLYDPVTERCIDDKCHILFVTGTNYKGNEKYTILIPRFLQKIVSNGLRFPAIFNEKPCYWFRYNDVKWESFNGRNKQKKLEIKGDMI